MSRPIESAEAAIQHVQETEFSGPSFTLQIADNLTFAGEPDPIGMGMAMVLDAILAKGFSPDGFEEKHGYRMYRYVRDE